MIPSTAILNTASTYLKLSSPLNLTLSYTLLALYSDAYSTIFWIETERKSTTSFVR